MRVILREHVDHLGERGAIVDVARGYARNYLLPKGLAWEATPGNVKQLEHQRKVWAARDARELEEAQAMADELGKLELSVARKAGESGTLYGSVTSSDVRELLAQRGFEIDRRKLIIAHPIKALGQFEIQVRLHPRVIGRVKLTVEGESAAAE